MVSFLDIINIPNLTILNKFIKCFEISAFLKKYGTQVGTLGNGGRNNETIESKCIGTKFVLLLFIYLLTHF